MAFTLCRTPFHRIDDQGQPQFIGEAQLDLTPTTDIGFRIQQKPSKRMDRATNLDFSPLRARCLQIH